MIRKLAITFFGLGYLRPAPGTWGSLGAIVVAGALFGLLRSAGAERWFDLAIVAGIAVSCVLSVAWGPWAIEYYGKLARKPGDPSHFVLDEVAGQWLSILLLPMARVSSFQDVLVIYGVQFLLFRVFDIVKPPPGRQLEKLPAGWGVLMDDLGVAVYANLLGQILVRYWFSAS